MSRAPERYFSAVRARSIAWLVAELRSSASSFAGRVREMLTPCSKSVRLPIGTATTV